MPLHCALWFALLLSCARADAATLNIGQGTAYPAIGVGINASERFDTVVVAPGTYTGDSIFIDHPITLKGEPGAVLDADGRGSLLIITSDSVTVSGLILRNTALSFVDDVAALTFENVSHCTALDNVLENNFFGIYLSQSYNCNIENNVISSKSERETTSGNGIHMWYCKDTFVSGNRISGHRDGIYMEFVENATIVNNLSEKNVRYGMHFMFSDNCEYVNNYFSNNGAGVAVMYSENVRMSGNTFIDNWGAAAYGLLLRDITGSEVSRNAFINNSSGIYAENAIRVTVRDCTFNDNGWAVKIMSNSQDNVFTGNNFVGNTFDVATNNSEYYSKFEGNYWSSYRGYDLDRDGIGDTPYRPVSLFSMLVEQQPPALLLLRSAFVDVLDAAERILPALTPGSLTDNKPMMRPISLPVAGEFASND